MIDLIAAALITIGHGHGGGHGGGSGHGHSHGHAKSAGNQIIEGCEFDGYDWVYADGSPCRGTGEDPTVDSEGLPACADGRVATEARWKWGTCTHQCIEA